MDSISWVLFHSVPFPIPCQLPWVFSQDSCKDSFLVFSLPMSDSLQLHPILQTLTWEIFLWPESSWSPPGVTVDQALPVPWNLTCHIHSPKSTLLWKALRNNGTFTESFCEVEVMVTSTSWANRPNNHMWTPSSVFPFLLLLISGYVKPPPNWWQTTANLETKSSRLFVFHLLNTSTPQPEGGQVSVYSKSNQVKKDETKCSDGFLPLLIRIRFSLAQGSCLPFPLAPYIRSTEWRKWTLGTSQFSLSKPWWTAGVFPEFFFPSLLILPNHAQLSHHLGCFLLPPAELGSQTYVIVGCSRSSMSSVRTGIVSPSGSPVPGIRQATGLNWYSDPERVDDCSNTEHIQTKLVLKAEMVLE